MNTNNDSFENLESAMLGPAKEIPCFSDEDLEWLKEQGMNTDQD